MWRGVIFGENKVSLDSSNTHPIAFTSVARSLGALSFIKRKKNEKYQTPK